MNKWSLLFLAVGVNKVLSFHRNAKALAHHSAYCWPPKSSWNLTQKRGCLLPQGTNLTVVKSLRQRNVKGQNFPLLRWIAVKNYKSPCFHPVQTWSTFLLEVYDSTKSKLSLSSPGLAAWPLRGLPKPSAPACPCVAARVAAVDAEREESGVRTLQVLQDNP